MQSLNVRVFDLLEHYYVVKMNVICCHLSEVNISKTEFIVLYDRTRILEFAAENVINA